MAGTDGARRDGRDPLPRRTALLRCAALASVVTGLGFGLPGVVGLRHLAGQGEVWEFLGFPTYGEGPFADAGLPTSVPLLGAFVVVCAAEVVVGVLLWRGRALRASLLLLPLELAFWIGFALPFGPPLGLARAVAVVLAERVGVAPRPRAG